MRTLPPSGVPITFLDICAGLAGALRGRATVELFRADICSYFGVKHCFLVSSGRAALSMILTALHRLHPERNEVVLPAYTSFSVPSAVVNAGLKVSLYDLDVATLSPNMASLEKALTDRTLCIVVCHLYGYPCDMDAIRELAIRKGIPLVDDAAQAMGATYKGSYAGTLGTAGLFSLSRGKNISTVDGGIIVTDSDELAETLSRATLQQTGFVDSMLLLVKAAVLSLLLRPRLYWLPARLSFLKLGVSTFAPDFPLQRFTSFQAGIGRRMLRRLKQITAARMGKAAKMMLRFEVAELRSQDASELRSFEVAGDHGATGSALHLSNSNAPRLIQSVAGSVPVYLRFPLITNANPFPELGIVRSYPKPLNEIAELKSDMVNDGEFPGAKYLAEHLLTLPTHEFVSAADIEKAVAKLQKAVTELLSC